MTMVSGSEVAASVVFLLSEAAGYVTGTDLLVDDGVVASMLRGAEPSTED